MKVMYFKRVSHGMHIHSSNYMTGVYVPKENVVLTTEQHGTFGGHTYSIVDNKLFLSEMQKLLEGKDPAIPGVTYSKMKEFEYDGQKLKDLIVNLKSEKELKKTNKSGIEELLEAAK
ncbi:MAG: hypothetical protein ABIB43_05745 [archaeon]